MVSKTLEALQKQAVTTAGGRRVNRKRVPKSKRLSAKKAEEQQKQKENAMPQLPVDPADMAAFKEKLEAGELDQKLMDILKSQAPQKNNAADKTNNVEVPKQMSNAEIDRKLKQDIAAQKEQFAKATEKVNKVVAEVEAEAAAEASKAAVQETKQEKQVENKPVVVGEYTDIGSEHQGLRYDPKHYDGEDEEAEMMAALNNRETIRYNLGL